MRELVKNAVATVTALGTIALLSAGNTPARQAETKTTVTKSSSTKAKPSGRGEFESREALNTEFDKELDKLEERRIAALTRLAASQKPEEADLSYRELFNLAIARDQYDAAEEAADAYLKNEKGSVDLRATAAFINAIAKVDKKEPDRAIEGLRTFLKSGAGPEKKLDSNMVFAVGESFLQRLIRAGDYKQARRVCELFISDDPDPAVRDHFNARLQRINMLGKAAPSVLAEDVDGKKVRLADFKGKVVLVDFWALWCPPCVAAMPHLNALYSKYHDKGFEIVGVNLDAVHPGVKETSKALPVVRRFLLSYKIPWVNILNGTEQGDFVKAFGVTELPATFLIDRDGKIVHFEQSGEELDKALAEILGDSKSAKEAGEAAKATRTEKNTTEKKSTR